MPTINWVPIVNVMMQQYNPNFFTVPDVSSTITKEWCPDKFTVTPNHINTTVALNAGLHLIDFSTGFDFSTVSPCDYSQSRWTVL